MLLLDEVTDRVQPNIIKKISHVITGRRGAGQIANVLCGQFLDFAFGLAEEFVALNRGKVVLAKAKATLAGTGC